MKQRLGDQVRSRQPGRGSKPRPQTTVPQVLHPGEGGCAAAACSRSAQQALLEGESGHVPHLQDSPVPFPQRGSRGLWALKERETNGFNVYHPKVQCHGNPGTPASPTTSGGRGGCSGQGGQRANTRPQLPAPPVFSVGAGLE